MTGNNMVNTNSVTILVSEKETPLLDGGSMSTSSAVDRGIIFITWTPLSSPSTSFIVSYYTRTV